MKKFALLAIFFLGFWVGLSFAADIEVSVNSEKILPPLLESGSHPFKLEHFAQLKDGEFVSLQPYLSLDEIVVKTGPIKKEWGNFLVARKKIDFINYSDLWLFQIKSDSKEKLLDILNRLRREPDVQFAMPVFNFSSGKYFPSGQFIARFKTKEAGVDDALRNSYNQKNNVSEKDFNEEKSLTLLEITRNSPKNIFALVNSYFEETNIISEAYPLYERIYPSLEARFLISKKTVTVGELFVISLIYEKSADIEVDDSQFSSQVSFLKPAGLHPQLFEIKKIIGYDFSSGSVGRQKRQIDYVVSVFSPGEFKMPPLTIVYKEKDWNGKIAAKEWKPSEENYPKLNVVRLLPDSANEIKGVVRPDIAVNRITYFAQFILWAIFLMSFWFVSAMMSRRSAKARAMEKPKINFKEPLSNLEEFLNREWSREEKLKETRSFLKEIIIMKFPGFSRQDIRFLTLKDIDRSLGKLKKTGASDNFCSSLNSFLAEMEKIEYEDLILNKDKIIGQINEITEFLEQDNGI